MKRSMLCLALLLGGSSLAQAQAQVSGEVRHGQISYSLLDLDPDDGIAPSLRFLPLPGPGEDRLGTVAGYVNLSTDNGSSSGALYGDEPGDFVHALTVPQMAGVSLRAEARGDPGATMLSIDAWTASPQPLDVSFADSWIQSDPLVFVLSPNTRLTMSSSGSYAASVAGNGHEGYFLFSSQLFLYTRNANGDYVYHANDLAEAEYRNTIGSPSNAPGTLSDDFSLSVEWDNLAATDATAFAVFNARADLYSFSRPVAPPVPEPGALPMFAAGLAGLGIGYLRRKSRKP